MLFAADPTAEHNLLTDLTVGQLIAMAATLIVIVTIARKINPILRRLNELLDDWFGQKARPGVTGRKGVMERLSDQDEAIDDARKRIEPLVDAKAAGNHAEVLKRLDSIVSVEHRNAGHMTRVERLLMRHIRESKKWVADVTSAADGKYDVPAWPNIPDDDTRGKDHS